MITDEAIEKTLDWLRNDAMAAATARANRVYMEEYRKSLKAIIMGESGAKTIAAKEAEAYADPRYLEHLQVMKEAIKVDEVYRWRMTAAEAQIEAWRTMQANNRTQARI